MRIARRIIPKCCRTARRPVLAAYSRLESAALVGLAQGPIRLRLSRRAATMRETDPRPRADVVVRVGRSVM